MRGLKSLEVDSGSYGSLLTPILIDKLPKELRLEATKQLKEDWDLDELIKIFKRELEARERASLLPSSSRDPHLSHCVNLRSHLHHLCLLLEEVQHAPTVNNPTLQIAVVP